MFHNDTTELDVLLLVGDDAAAAERCLAAIVAVSIDVPLRTWIVEAQADLEGAAMLHKRCVWARAVDPEGTPSVRVNRALGEGRSPLILVVDGSASIDADALRDLLRYARAHAELSAIGLGVLAERHRELRPGALGPVLVLRRDALHTVGGFDERAFAGVGAEAEAWCRRAERAGLEVRTSSVPTADTRPGKVVRTSPRLVLGKPLDQTAIALERRAFRSRLGAPSSSRTEPWEALERVLVDRAKSALGNH
jgi:hypothetical protein